MGLAVNRCYITPILSDGTLQVEDSESTWATGRGVFTLAPGTYYFVLPLGGTTTMDVHLTHDDVFMATGMIQTCSHAKSDVSDYSAVDGEWISQLPDWSYVATEGFNTSDINGLVTILGGFAGGASWQASQCSSARARLELVVLVGGEVRVSFTGKE
jgi:hypothetical protein